MMIFPAVDIQNGKGVRLKKGVLEDMTIYADDPLELARRWQSEGAAWLHVIDLDGAFSGQTRNRDAVAAIVRETGLRVQIGGGIRSLETARWYLETGATRLIIGTTALEEPELLREMCREFPGRIGVSLDGSNGRLKTRGWVRDAGITLEEAVPRLEDSGIAFIIYTDIERDGARSGVNRTALARLLRLTSLPVLAAGGVATLADIQALHELCGSGNLEGVVSGRAICEGSLNLREANDWLAAHSSR